jgi:hypothetical protein
MTKVVLGKYGFAISRAAWLRLLELGFDPYYKYTARELHFPPYWFDKEDFRWSNEHLLDDIQYEWWQKDLEWFGRDPLDDKRYLIASTFMDYLRENAYRPSIPRDDPRLVQVVEELGINANPDEEFWFNEDGTPHKEDDLHIIEIPDDCTEWYVDEPSGGYEFVREVHRTFP